MLEIFSEEFIMYDINGNYPDYFFWLYDEYFYPSMSMNMDTFIYICKLSTISWILSSFDS